MAKSVDLDLLRRVTEDSIYVYDMISRAQTLIEENQRIIRMAEDLLRHAGLAYLLDSKGIKTERSSSSNPPDEMVSAYIQIQQFYSDLKDVLYRLGKARIKDKAQNNASIILEVLHRIDPLYRDVEKILQQHYLDQAISSFEQGLWDQGLSLLKQSLPDKESRLIYFCNFLLENDVRTDDGLQALRREEPRISTLASFQNLLNYVVNWRGYEKKQKSIWKTQPWANYAKEMFQELISKIPSFLHKSK